MIARDRLAGYWLASETLLDFVWSFFNFWNLDIKIHFLLESLSQKEGTGGPHNRWVNSYRWSNKVVRSPKVAPLFFVPWSSHILESD
jgi:hypothetical protein